MANLIQANLDFLLFVQSVALLLLVIQAWLVSRTDTGFRWLWLGAFFLTQTASVWMDILSLSGLGWESLELVQAWVLAASFLSLAEFARSSAHPLGRFKPGIWIYIPLIAIASLVVRFPSDLSLKAGIIYALALPCGAWVGILMWRSGARHPFRQARMLLRQTALAISVYSISRILIAPTSSELLYVQENAIPDLAVLSAMLASSLLAVLMFWLLLQYNTKLSSHSKFPGKMVHSESWQNRIWMLLGVLVVTFGWLAAEFTGHGQDALMRRGIMERTQLAASMVPVNQAANLKWDETDLSNPDYLRLKELMKAMVRANTDVRFAMLMGLRDGKSYFLVDSEVPTSKDYSPPGQYYEEAEISYLASMSKQEPFVLGPIVDHWGSWITSSVPLQVHLSHPGHVTLELDVAATGWNSKINRARLPIHFITLLITALLVGSWLSQSQIRKHSAKIAISEHRSRTIVEGSPNCVQMFDNDGLCLTINQNGLNALGRDKSEIIGRPFYSIWPAEARSTLMVALESTLLGHPNQFEADYVRPDGRSISWSVSISPMGDENGAVTGFVSISVDITDRKLAEQAMRKAKDAAEAATRTKSEFLAVMSHEIRTPLSGVIGMLGLLQKQKLETKSRRYAELARESAETLLEILDDVLDTAKIESGKLLLESIPFKPRVEFTRVVEVMRTRADAKELGLSLEIGDSIPEVIYGDPLRVRQVLANLISNAIKFTSQGGIRVVLEGEVVGDYFLHFHLTVADTGVGIAPAALERIFNKFEQEDSTTTRQFGGTGLGLAIVKSIADLMGGDVTVSSRLGEGSTFVFSALMALGSVEDMSAAKPSAGTAGSLHSSARLSILCAEDNATNRLVIQHVVHHMGHDADFAENGREAVEKLRVHRYDAVLMDSRMPEMDGFQATMLIRSPGSGVLDPLVQIIALTANTANNYREQCLAAGMNDYLEKPVREDALHAALERVIAYQLQRGVPLNQLQETTTPAPVSPSPLAPPAPAGQPQGLSVEELLAMAGEQIPAQARQEEKQVTPRLSSEALQSITRQYLRDAPLRLKEMNEALQRKDGPVLARAAHSLKSMSRYVSAVDLSNHCAQIETLADEERFDETIPLIHAAELEFAQARSRLQNQLIG